MYGIGDYERARTYYRQAIEQRPQLADAHAGLANIALRDDDFANAAAELGEAYRLAPSHPDYRTNLASALFYAGEHDRAIEHYQALFKLDQEKLSPYLECARAFRLKRDFRRSFDTIEYALDFFETKKILASPKNDSDWFFIIGNRRYYLTGADEKRSYAYSIVRLSARLSGDLEAAKRFESGAPDLLAPTAKPVLEAIVAEAKELSGRHPGVAANLDGYLRELRIPAGGTH